MPDINPPLEEDDDFEDFEDWDDWADEYDAELEDYK